MRARLALKLANLSYEKIEVDLKNKPQALFDYSPKGTVPVLVLNSGEIIDESLEIVDWVFTHYLDYKEDKTGESLILELTESFIPALNRYKYASRYTNVDMEKEAASILQYFEKLERVLSSEVILSQRPSKYNIAIFPFIRQANIANVDWLNQPEFKQLKIWFMFWSQGAVFEEIMKK